MDISWRHEVKHYLNWSDLMSIRARARAVMQLDPHAKDGKYLIRSLYFDTPTDKALREKNDGVNLREKFRIRYYNEDIWEELVESVSLEEALEMLERV